MEEKLLSGSDYFANLGDRVRWVAAWALTPLAVLFSLMALCTPIAALGIFWTQGDARLAGIVLVGGLGYAVVIALPLCWITYRLFRGGGGDKNRTVLPLWLIRTFLVAFLGPLSVGMAWWFARQGLAALMAGNAEMAVFWLLSAVGWIVGWLRAARVAFFRQRLNANNLP